MRLSGRLFLVLGLATGTAVVTLFACGVDQEPHLPGLPDALPNNPGGAGFVAGLGAGGASSGAGGGSGFGGAGGAVGAGGSTSTGTQGAQSVCDLIVASTVSGSACANCVNQAAGSGCVNQAQACDGNTLCLKAEMLCAACTPGSGAQACVESCINYSVDYQALVACENAVCASSCGVTPPLTCSITDGG